MSHHKPQTEREWQARDAQLAEIDRILQEHFAHLSYYATSDLLDLIDSHRPNEDDPTSCPHCGMAEEVEHIPGCPCKDRRAL